jgi:hypothetical protein
VSLGNGCGAVDGLVAMLTDVNGHGHRKPLSLWDRTRPSSRQLKLRAAVGAAPPRTRPTRVPDLGGAPVVCAINSCVDRRPVLDDIETYG